MAIHTASLSITDSSDLSIHVYEEKNRIVGYLTDRPFLLPIVSVVVTTALVGFKVLSSLPMVCRY